MPKPNLKPEERIILALDSPDPIEARGWVERFRGKIKTFKVGPILFLNSGESGLREFAGLGANIFLDLKFHDIPSTVEKASIAAARFGVGMFTVHALGGFEMMRSSAEAVLSVSENLSIRKPLVLAVTVLTSHDAGTLAELGIGGSPRDTVLRLASLADKAGVDGLVASGMEVEMLRAEFGDRFTLVAPGIRIGGGDAHDQQRVSTPRDAIAAGADYLVIGRAITGAKEPEKAADEIVGSL